MIIQFGIGNRVEELDVSEKNLIGVLSPNEVEHAEVGIDCVRTALANPIGAGKLRDLVKPGQKIVICTSDITRPMPTAACMPAIIEELDAAGISDEDVTIVFARGNHRSHTEAEHKKLAGDEAYSRYRCVDTDGTDCVNFGTTKHGTPVDITRVVAEADFRICLGNIEYHYFAGYSGGAKAIMPGSSTREAIQVNHKLMVEADSHAGKLEGNPVRMDIEEAAAMVGIDFILNVVLDEHKQIIGAFAGDWIKAHRVGCEFLDRLYQKPIEERADIVITSQGGAPKDLNLYQTQKALDNAKHAVKPGGVIIVVGSCAEGLGERVFEQWINEAETSHDLIERVRANFQLGGHKAAAIALVLEQSDIYLVSDMDDEIVRNAFLEPYGSLDAAYAAALAKMGEDATVIAMPYGGSTLPVEK